VRSFGLSSLAPITPEATIRAASRPFSRLLAGSPRLKTVLREARQRARMRALRTSLASVDAILVGGGDLLSDRNLHFPQSLVLLAELAGRHGKHLYCLGCGAESEWSAPGLRRIRTFLRTCREIAVRDESTARRVGALLGRPIPVFGDFALAEECLATTRSDNGPRESFAVNVQSLPPEWRSAQPLYEYSLCILGERIRRITTMRLCLFTTGAPEDLAPMQRVLARLSCDAIEAVFPKSLDALHATLERSAFVIASRLHAGILAVRSGAAVFTFAPQPKVQRFFATFGLAQFCFTPSRAAELIDRLNDVNAQDTAAAQRAAMLRSASWSFRRSFRLV